MIKPDYRFFPGHFLRSELLRSASVLISGTIIAQLVPILLQPVLRRLFTPEDFGVYTVYLSLVGIIMIFSSLRYDDAIVLPKSDKESTNVLGLAVMINITINIVIFAILIILRENIITFLNLPSDFPLSILAIIPLGAMLFSTYGSLNAWLIRKKQYVSISVNKLIRRSSEGASQMGLAFLKTSNGLIYSDIIGQTANLATVAIQVKKCGLDLKMISLNKLKYVFRKYSEFPRFNLIPALMSACSYLLPPIFINKYFSSETAGFFDLSKLVLSIPLAFIASSLTSVLLQRVSEKFNRKESFINDLKPVFIIVTLIAVGEVVIVVLFGEKIFSFAFGKEWTTSGAISKIMVWSFAINFIVSTFSSIFFSMRRIKTFSVWQFFYFILILSLVLFKHLPFYEFLKIYVIIEVFCFLTVATILAFIIYRYESAITLTTSNKV